MLNYRKEYFSVTLDEIEHKIRDLGLDTEFIRIPEAMEYRETLAILSRLNTPESSKSIEEIIAEDFPSSLT